MNIKKLLVLSILVLILSIQKCYAAEWKEVSYKTYIDTSSVRMKQSENSDTYIIYWVKSLNNGRKWTKDLEKKYKTKLWFVLEQVAINENQKTFIIISSTSYDLYGESIDGYDNDINNRFLEWDKIPPETKIEEEYNFLENFLHRYRY